MVLGLLHLRNLLVFMFCQAVIFIPSHVKKKGKKKKSVYWNSIFSQDFCTEVITFEAKMLI